MGLLDGDIKSTVNSALSGIMLDLTIRRQEGGSYDPKTFSDTNSPQTYSAKGMIEDYDDELIDGSLITEKDRKILILAESLSIEPETSDEIIDPDGNEFSIVRVKSDPAGATWEIQGRR